MAIDFPVPRAELPRVDVSPHERQARKQQMERLLQASLDEYARFREEEQGRIDPKRWKLVTTQDRLQLFRERLVGSSGQKNSIVMSNSEDDASFAGDPSLARSSQEDWEELAFDATSASALSEGKQSIKSLMLVGELQGRMENAVYAVTTKSHEELALVNLFLHNDVADCGILNVMEGPTPERPLHFLGYKWFVKKSPGGGRIVKHRDLVYMEYCGVTKTERGEKIGFLLMESVDLPAFPEFKSRKCIRAVQSVCILLRQKSDNIVDLFMTGLVEPSGKIMKPFMSFLTTQTMFVVARLMDLAECKRLTKMVVTQRQSRDDQMYSRAHKPTACSLCHQRRKFYNGVSLVDCSICGHVICTRCQTHKRVFIGNGVLGQFHRVGCCKTCVLSADHTRLTASAPMKVSISAQIQRQNSHSDINSLENPSFSRPRSSSDSSMLSADALNAVAQLSIPDDAPQPESESPPVVVTRLRRGSVEQPSTRDNVRQYSQGITLLPESSMAAERNHDRLFNTTGGISMSNSRMSTRHQPLQRARSDSVASADSGSSSRQQLTQISAITTSRNAAPPSFSSSAPGGTYDLRGQMPIVPVRPSPSTSIPRAPRTPVQNTQQDLFARMMELRRVAESTYQTTRQNQVYMQQTGAPPTPQQSGGGHRFGSGF